MGLLSKATSRIIRQIIEEEFIQYHTAHGVLSGIIFETPENMEYRGFNDELSAITASFALTLPLPPFRCLILFPSSIDKELVAHRISGTLKTEVCFLFESENPEGAFESLRPYL
ncbi:hypothetical protein LQZ21_02105 [Treponema sp. TIM-1]|uniref:hypothetical protein n=1 Tax=Treponema sp. TIM-1 TaxID=2898417 RepID=UPI00397F1ABA